MYYQPNQLEKGCPGDLCLLAYNCTEFQSYAPTPSHKVCAESKAWTQPDFISESMSRFSDGLGTLILEWVDSAQTLCALSPMEYPLVHVD